MKKNWCNNCLFATSNLAAVWCAAFICIGEFNFTADPILTWSSKVQASFLSVVQEPNDSVKLFLIDSLKNTWVSGVGKKFGTKKKTLSSFTLVTVACGNVV